MKFKLPKISKRLGQNVAQNANSDESAQFYSGKDYLEAYTKHTNARVEQNPQTAIGGLWEEMGQLQFDFLTQNGLQPQNTMLDIGCGTLRGGRHFIRFLNPGNYNGIDLSPKAIEAGYALVKEEGLTDKRPRLIVNEAKDLKFGDFAEESFDFLLAQSVFTHLLPEHIEECFQHVGNVLNASSRFFFTFHEGPQKSWKNKNFQCPISFFQNLADQYGFTLEDYSSRYPHPRNQHMLCITKK